MGLSLTVWPQRQRGTTEGRTEGQKEGQAHSKGPAFTTLALVQKGGDQKEDNQDASNQHFVVRGKVTMTDYAEAN